ncbi:MAG: twin-arginine translocase subunit TatC [Dehalococcoidia bacterium]|nr:twin-arginine translocase subunit TatC [Dehalococcoidia bacterium]
MSQQPQEQPLRVHLKELRRRLFVAALGVAITTVVAFGFHRNVIEILIRPAIKAGSPLIFTEVTEMLGVSMKVSLMGGLILALPLVAYEVVMFISPALTSRERRYVLLFLPAITFAFIAGVAFGYLVLIPPAMGFLLTFNADIAQPMIRIGNYMSLILTLLFWMGVVFEIPVFMFVLARLRIVSYKRFSQWRRFAIVLAFVLGAVITPTFDPVNQTLVSAPIVLLYEIGIWLAWLARSREKPQAASGADAP